MTSSPSLITASSLPPRGGASVSRRAVRPFRARLERPEVTKTGEFSNVISGENCSATHSVPRRGIYDNMRTAVDKVGRGKERQVNARFSAMVSHFLFEAEFCNPASGWEKGQIEKNVQDARHRFWQPAPNFPSLAALNDWLEARCRELWAQTLHGSQPGAIVD